MLKHLKQSSIDAIIRLKRRSLEAGETSESAEMFIGEKKDRPMENIPPEMNRLVEYIEALPTEQRTELLAMLWYAHADERGLPFNVLLTHARTSVSRLPEYVAGMEHLEGSLKRGLAKLTAGHPSIA